MPTTAQTLMAMYEAMRERFGRQGWWPAAATEPGERALEICIGAILTQNTSWKNVERALANLRVAGAVGVSKIHAMPHAELAGLIRPAGYFNVKAKRLKNFIACVHAGFGDDIKAFLDRPVATLTAELLSVNGVGRETADSIVLYAARRCTFVVDAYTGRILFRHGLVGPDDDVESIKHLFESSLPADVGLFNDFHAQLVAVGKTYCRPRRPDCDACPLAVFPHDTDTGVD